MRSLNTKSKTNAVQAIDFITPSFKEFFSMAKANPQFSADQLQDFARRYFDRLLAESKRMQLARKFKRGELEHFITHLAEIEDRLEGAQSAWTSIRADRRRYGA